MNVRLVILFCLVAAGCGWSLRFLNAGGWQPVAQDAPVQTKPLPPRPHARPAFVLRSNVEAVTRAMESPESDKQQLAREWAGSDPEQFLSWLFRAKPPPSQEVLNLFFADWVRTNPDAAFEAALGLPDQFPAHVRSILLGRMMSAILNEDWRVGLRWLERAQEADVVPMRLVGDFVWLEDATLEMGQALAKFHSGNFALSLLSRFSSAFSKRDPLAARQWALSLRPEQARWAMDSVLHHWASDDLKGALAYLETTASSNIRQNLSPVVMRVFAGQDPRAALRWAETHMPVPNGSGTILTTWANGDLNGVTEYVVGLEDPQRREAYVEILADGRRRRSSSHLIDWVTPLSAENRAVALNTVANQITRFAKGARRQQWFDYVGGLPEAEISDTLLREMRLGIGSREPMQGLQWAASLPGDRADFALETVLGPWLENNRERTVERIEGMEQGPAREAARRVLERLESQ